MRKRTLEAGARTAGEARLKQPRMAAVGATSDTIVESAMQEEHYSFSTRQLPSMQPLAANNEDIPIPGYAAGTLSTQEFKSTEADGYTVADNGIQAILDSQMGGGLSRTEIAIMNGHHEAIGPGEDTNPSTLPMQEGFPPPIYLAMNYPWQPLGH